VLDVHDGDSLTLVNATHTYHIRLNDIDAPELAQPYGKESRTSLRSICLLKKATAESSGEDQYGRTLVRVQCAGVDASAEQVRRGLAWVFDRYAPRTSPLYGLQAEAREARRGLWSADNPTPPWVYRRVKRATELPK
jgi:endonuclease YncB( thermonuclease family)